jgi:septal ring factor EnvC (AmiA/AmiB activator)
MSVSETSHSASFDVPPLGGLASGTRVDAAHVIAKDVEAAVATPSALQVAEPEAVARVRTQASQLAAYLQRQATSVDHRESELNSRLASLENQIRGARLWISEQHLDIEQRQAEINRREQALDEREARAKSPTVAARKTQGSATVDADNLARREAEILRRQSELDALAARLADQLAASHEVEDARRALETLDARAKELERGEQMLAADQAEVQRQRNQLALARSRFAEETETERQRTAQQQERLAVDHDKARLELKRQADELAARQTVLEQMRADVSRSQQEVLEIRLATEELWARLCGTMAPAALSRSLAQIRVQLAEQQKLARAELAQQKFEIQELSARLTEQHQKLSERRTAIEHHSNQRQQELAAQAARLVEQERQLHEQLAELNRERESWQDERFRLNQEIRRLLRERSRPLHAA